MQALAECHPSMAAAGATPSGLPERLPAIGWNKQGSVIHEQHFTTAAGALT